MEPLTCAQSLTLMMKGLPMAARAIPKNHRYSFFQLVLLSDFPASEGCCPFNEFEGGRPTRRGTGTGLALCTLISNEHMYVTGPEE